MHAMEVILPAVWGNSWIRLSLIFLVRLRLLLLYDLQTPINLVVGSGGQNMELRRRENRSQPSMDQLPSPRKKSNNLYS